MKLLLGIKQINLHFKHVYIMTIVSQLQCVFAYPRFSCSKINHLMVLKK